MMATVRRPLCLATRCGVVIKFGAMMSALWRSRRQCAQFVNRTAYLALSEGRYRARRGFTSMSMRTVTRCVTLTPDCHWRHSARGRIENCDLVAPPKYSVTRLPRELEVRIGIELMFCGLAGHILARSVLPCILAVIQLFSSFATMPDQEGFTRGHLADLHDAQFAGAAGDRRARIVVRSRFELGHCDRLGKEKAASCGFDTGHLRTRGERRLGLGRPSRVALLSTLRAVATAPCPRTAGRACAGGAASVINACCRLRSSCSEIEVAPGAPRYRSGRRGIVLAQLADIDPGIGDRGIGFGDARPYRAPGR